MAIPIWQASLTKEARRISAIQLTQPIVVGDYSFQLGTGGVGGDPLVALDVDPEASALTTPVGPLRALGRVLVSGAGAALNIVDGKVVVSGLSGIEASGALRWLTLSGSAGSNVNGTWLISEVLAADTVVIENKLVDADDAGPLDWEHRHKVVVPVSDSARSFHAYLPKPDPLADGTDLSEVGIFARVIFAPSLPLLQGSQFLLAKVNHPSVVKHLDNVLSHYICVQR